MGDNQVKNILNQWKLECMINKFEVEEIDLEAFNALTPEFIEKLFKDKPLGTQLKFAEKFKSYIEFDKKKADENIQQFESIEEIPVLHYNLDDFRKKSNIEDTVNQSEIVSSKSSTKAQFFDSIQHLDLYQLLFDNFRGKIVLNKYEKGKELTDSDQSQIADIISSELLCYTDPFGHPFQLKNFHYEILAKQICQLFPKENISIYYVEPKSEGEEQKISKGKIPDSFRNKLRILRDEDVIPGKRKRKGTENNDQNIISVNSNQFTTALEFLRSSVSPWETVIKYWDESYVLRTELREEEGGTLHTFLEKFPIIKHPDGYTLLERDYAKIFENRSKSFEERWPDFREKLLALMKTELKDELSIVLLESLEVPSVKEVVKDLTVLTLISALCPPVSRIRVNKRKMWKPSIAESSRGFILHVKAAKDLENERSKRISFMSQYNLSLQPYVVIVGPTFEDIQASYINIDRILYKIESPLKAVDICYKIFQVLNLKYPNECEQIWLLLQQSLYENETIHDKKIKGVIRLKAKLN